jgi:iron complex outermembrane receptor protein
LYDQSFVPQTGLRRDLKTVLPITGNNMEIGVKRDWFGGKWNTSLSAYRILKNNQISNDPDNTANEFYVVQFGQTTTEGIEFDVRGQIIPGLNLVANYALTDSKISKADDNNKATIGNKVPGYAKHTANAWLTYKLQEGVLKGFGVNAGFTYLAERTTWSWGDAGQQMLPNYFKLDGGLTYEKDRFVITANVFNILDKYLYSGAYYGYGGYYYWQAEAGRNLRLGISYKF